MLSIGDLVGNGIHEAPDGLMEDEYLGESGLPYCKKCRTARVVQLGGKLTVRCLCACQSDESRRREEEERRKRVQEEFRLRCGMSMLGERYRDVGFAQATLTDRNRAAYRKGASYVVRAQEVYENNIGLYIYGGNSSGKTHLSACICNGLLRKGYRCIYTNLFGILNEIRKGYDGRGMGEGEVLDRLRTYEFAFLDDLGKEFIGREHREDTAKWAEGKLFEVINERYNAQKPTIFTSNYGIEDLVKVLRFDKAIAERINEMSTRVIRLEGDDFRQVSREEKSAFAKGLGI